MAAYSKGGPFFSHTAGYEPQRMLDACQHLEDVLEDLGPFDGVLGFSQGAALLISLMHWKQELGEELPFRFAMCFSSIAPCAARDDECVKVIDQLRLKLLEHGAEESSDGSGTSRLTPTEQSYSNLLHDTVMPAHRRHHSLLHDVDMDVYTNPHYPRDAPLVMHPALLARRIRTPTVHVIGKHDAPFMQNMSETAYGLCDADMSKLLYHSGSHQPPQARSEAVAAVGAMEWAISQSRKTVRLHS